MGIPDVEWWQRRRAEFIEEARKRPKRRSTAPPKVTLLDYIEPPMPPEPPKRPFGPNICSKVRAAECVELFRNVEYMEVWSAYSWAAVVSVSEQGGKVRFVQADGVSWFWPNRIVDVRCMRDVRQDRTGKGRGSV